MALLDNPSQVGSLAMSLIVSPLVIVAIILRFIATRRAARKVGAEDWFALMATVACLGYNTTSILGIVLLDGRDFTEVPLDLLTQILKASYICTQFFPLNQFFAKLSILFLYHRIFSINKHYSFWIILLGILQIAWTIAAVFTLLFQCTPVHHYWDVLSPGRCLGIATTLVAFEVPNSSIDFAMVALALVMLRDLRIRRSTKWKLNLLFAAGGFCGVIGFLKIAAHFTAGQKSNTALSLWGNAQMLLSVFCCCVPIYNSLFSPRPGTTSSTPHSHASPSSSSGRFHSFVSKTFGSVGGSKSGSAAERTLSNASTSVSEHGHHHHHHEHSHSWGLGLKGKVSHSTIGSATTVGRGHVGGGGGELGSGVPSLDLELGGGNSHEGGWGWVNLGDDVGRSISVSAGGGGGRRDTGMNGSRYV